MKDAQIQKIINFELETIVLISNFSRGTTSVLKWEMDDFQIQLPEQ